MPGASDLELDLFINLCRAKRLDPLTKQIYAVKTGTGWQYFASIDGLRVIAQRSGSYLGQTAPFWCGADGQWRDVWLGDGAPAAAKVGVYKRGNSEPTWGVATFRSYGQGKKNNWLSMPDVMLAKCAEAIALRKAFPDDLSGVYVSEEMTEEQPSQPQARAATRVPHPVPILGRADKDTGEIIDVEVGRSSRITAEQAEEILTLRKTMNWKPEYVRAMSKDVADKENPGELTEEEASELLRALYEQQDIELQDGLNEPSS